jgi:hypothetical protein
MTTPDNRVARRDWMNEQTRKPFVEPTLTEEGSLAEVTLVSGGGGTGDSGVPT